MASREEREFSSQAPAPQVADILETGIFPAASGLLQRGLSDPNVPDSNPYSYTGQRIANFNPRENRAFGLTDQAIGSYMPFLQTGTDVLGQSADVYRQGIGQRFDPTSTDEFFNPFLDRVAGRVEDRVGKFISDRTNQLNLGAARTGNLGSARQGITEADITKQGIEGLTDALGSIYSKGFDNAQNLAFKDFQTGADRDRALGASLSDISGRTFNIANQLPNLQRQDISSLFSTGGLGRNRDQSLLDLGYQNFVGRYNLPFQNLQNVGNIVSALGPLAGGYGYAGATPAEDAVEASNPDRFAPGIPGVVQNNGGLNYQSGIMGSNVTPPTFGNTSLNPSLFPQQGITTLAGNTYSPPTVPQMMFGTDPNSTETGPGGIRY
jgi:hypothetical protein